MCSYHGGDSGVSPKRNPDPSFALSLSFRRQRAQRSHIHHVFAQIFAFWRFQHFRDFIEAGVPHDEAESLQTNFAFADMFMSIYPRAARGFGIVHMNGDEALESDRAIELAKCFFDRSFTSNVITGGKNVGRVQANTKLLRFAYIVEDEGDLLESVTKT